MDLLTKQYNRPIHERLSALAEELDENILDLAITEIRRQSECLRVHRAVIAELLAAQGVHDWNPVVGETPTRFAVSI